MSFNSLPRSLAPIFHHGQSLSVTWHFLAQFDQRTAANFPCFVVLEKQSLCGVIYVL